MSGNFQYTPAGCVRNQPRSGGLATRTAGRTGPPGSPTARGALRGLSPLVRNSIRAAPDHARNDDRGSSLPELPRRAANAGRCRLPSTQVCPSRGPQVPALRKRRVTPHVMRHSCAVALLQAGIDVSMIRDYLGHASVATTSRHITTNLQMKREVLEAFWKRSGLDPKAPRKWRPSPRLLAFLESLRRLIWSEHSVHPVPAASRRACCAFAPDNPELRNAPYLERQIGPMAGGHS